MKDLVLVDFDDTLVDTGPRFQNARRSLLAAMGTAGFAEDVAYDVLYNQVDPGMRARYGLGPRRMEPAFIATYERLCEIYDVPRDEDVLARCAELGRGVFGPPPAFEGALDALRRFRSESGGALPLIAAGGIATGDDAWQRIRAGASLVQLYSAMVYGGPGLPRPVRRLHPQGRPSKRRRGAGGDGDRRTSRAARSPVHRGPRASRACCLPPRQA